ncbi:MAG: hypothetical protein ACLPKB_22590 [Xanthobacteraceae bacterium]
MRKVESIITAFHNLILRSTNPAKPADAFRATPMAPPGAAGFPHNQLKLRELPLFESYWKKSGNEMAAARTVRKLTPAPRRRPRTRLRGFLA